MSAEVEVLVIGAGHAGLGVAARLRARGRDALVVSADARVGDTWRRRWASLRLFTPRFANGLPGMRFPDGADPFPGKDEVADYQERFAAELGLRVRTGTTVRRVRPDGDAFVVTLDRETLRARRVVVATGAHRTPRIPAYASALDARVACLHSSDYGTIGDIAQGPVLVVGAGNSGAEIAYDLALTRPVTLSSGGVPTYAPSRWRSPAWWRVAQFRSWLLRGRIPPPPLPWPLRPPFGRWVEVDLARAARERDLRLAARTIDAAGDTVRFADGTEMHPRTVIWATGFTVDDTWLEVPQSERGMSVGRSCRGPVPGLHVLRAPLLASLHWGTIAIANDIARRGLSGRSTPGRGAAPSR